MLVFQPRDSQQTNLQAEPMARLGQHQQECKMTSIPRHRRSQVAARRSKSQIALEQPLAEVMGELIAHLAPPHTPSLPVRAVVQQVSLAACHWPAQNEELAR